MMTVRLLMGSPPVHPERLERPEQLRGFVEVRREEVVPRAADEVLGELVRGRVPEDDRLELAVAGYKLDLLTTPFAARPTAGRTRSS